MRIPIVLFLLLQMNLAARETVVLLHGWWSSPLLMKRVDRSLKREGYAVVNLGYPSAWMPIEKIATEFLPERLRQLLSSDTKQIHFVTHSMGGLVLRRFLMTHRPPNLGRVVMLGPPNHGSEAADFWSRSAACRRIAGPNLAALRTGPAGFASTLPPADYQLLIIAGDRPISPFWSPIPKPHDGKVSVTSTHLAGMKAHHFVHSTHTLLPWNRETTRVVSQFLRDGGSSGSALASGGALTANTGGIIPHP